MSVNFFMNKTAIVTGASSGIGKATALALAEAGANIALAARRTALLEELAQDIQALGRTALVVPTDVTRTADVNQLVDQTLEKWGQVDILVANAGQYIRAPFREMKVSDIERAMAVNFYGGVYGILAVLPHMVARKSGHIVLVTSMDGKKGLPPDAPYVAAKFALSGFGEVLRQELHGTGVNVTIVFPGRVDTPLIENLRVPKISAKISSKAVARALVRGVQRRQPEVFVPPLVRVLYYLNVLSPRMGDWAVRVFHLQGWESE